MQTAIRTLPPPSVRRVRWCAVAGLTVALTACVASVPPPPPASAIPSLRAQVDRSAANDEAVLQLAVALWAEDDHEGALAVLERARAAVPTHPVYAAALGLAREGSGDFVGAREEYLAFLASMGSHPVSDEIAGRLDDLRGRTAAPLVRSLLATGDSLAHGQDAQSVVVIPLFDTEPAGAESVRLGAALTELVTRSLRERSFHAVDWELASAARAAVDEVDELPRARAMARVLAARRVALGRVVALDGDSARVALTTLRIQDDGSEVVEQDTVSASVAGPDGIQAAVTDRVWEMLAGVEPFSTPRRVAPEDRIQLATLLAFGQGLLALEDGDFDEAERALTVASTATEPVAAAAERLEQARSLGALGGAVPLPLGGELIVLARQLDDAAALLRISGAGTSSPLLSLRTGPSEAFGLDRLGAQVFLDILITVGGGG